MFSLLLAIIYMAFISLGLPDSLIGAAWPVMQSDLNTPLSYAGALTLIIGIGTIISSLWADKLIQKIKTGPLTAICVTLTAVALFGFSISSSFILLCIFAIPYGLGAGAIDAALNNYVALHYSSRHMSWLHAFWGVGVTISPNIMSYCLSNQYGWQMGFGSVAVLQIILAIIMFISLPLWKKHEKQNLNNQQQEKRNVLTIKQVFKLKGAPFVLIAFFIFCAAETTAGLWASSYLVECKNIDENTAALCAALFYFGETSGRFINGFVADKFGDSIMVRVGIIIMIIGSLFVLLPININIFAFIGLIIIGLGAAPIYPCIIHSTPTNFGSDNSQSMMGVMVASAYVGATVMPVVFGTIAQYISIALYPAYLLILSVLMIILTEKLNKTIKIA